MEKTKQKQEKSSTAVLAGKIAKRKSLRRSAAITPKLKSRAKNVVKRRNFAFSASTDSVELTNESTSDQSDISLPGHLITAPTCPIDLIQVENGVKALFEYLEKTQDNKTELFDDEQPIFLQIASVKVPKTPSHQIRLLLRHSLLLESSEVCLIVSDVGKAKEHDETVEHYEALLQAHGITNIKTIMPYHEFKTEYGNQFELKRKLVGLYDCFLVDARVSGYVTHSAGKIFMQKRKVPIPIKMNATNLKDHIEKSLSKTVLTVHSKSDSFSVQVGHTKMSQEEVFENVSSIIYELSTHFPGGLDNIRALNIKTDKSIAVPIYLSLKNKREVKVPIVKAKRPKLFHSVSGELTTYITKDVTVLPSGEVKLTDQEASGLSGEEYYEMESDGEGSLETDEEEDVELAGSSSDDLNEEDVQVEETEKQTNQEDQAKEDEDKDDFLDEAEEIYLNHYEQERTTKKKKKVANETNSDSDKTTLKKSNIKGKDDGVRKGTKKKQKETKTKKEETVEEGEDILTKAEEAYMNEYQEEQEQIATRKTRKTKAKVENKAGKETAENKTLKTHKTFTKRGKKDPIADSDQQEPSKPKKKKSKKQKVPEKTEVAAETVVNITRQARKTKAKEADEEISTKKSEKNVNQVLVGTLKANKTSRKRGRKGPISDSDQQEPNKPAKKSKKGKVSEKTAVAAEAVVNSTRLARKTKAKEADEEIPTKKNKKDVNQVLVGTKPIAENTKSRVIPAESKTKNKTAKTKSSKEISLAVNGEKVEEKGKKKANNASKSKVPETTELNASKVFENITKSTGKESKKTNKAVDEGTRDKGGKEKKIKSPTLKAKIKKVKKVATKKDVLKNIISKQK